MSAIRWTSLVAAVLLTVGCQATSGTGSAVQIEVDPRLTLTGTLAAPEGPGPFPAVVLMHGCNGLDPEVRRALEDHARHLVEAGFVTLILDSLTPRRVRPHVCNGQDSVPASDYRVRDAFQALQFLRSQPDVDGERVFLMGQSHGGIVALHVAAKGDVASQPLKDALGGGFRAVVAYYPWCAAPRNLDTPLLVLSGSKDNWTPPAECQRATARMRGAPYEVIVYPGEVHSFDLLMGLEHFLGFPVGGQSGRAPRIPNGDDPVVPSPFRLTRSDGRRRDGAGSRMLAAAGAGRRDPRITRRLLAVCNARGCAGLHRRTRQALPRCSGLPAARP
ncbi:MAG: alpha/beta hydrolase fold domain-containing protein [Chloroflexi bacterium]|nr:alpha/beta hydrolase fold domain-containing protein [Chloroflexota bacterium]